MTAPLAFTASVSIPPDVMAREVGDETVILDLASGSYFGLDALGTRIWQLLSAGATLAGVRETLLEEFDVAAEQVEADLLRLVAELRDAGLVKIA